MSEDKKGLRIVIPRNTQQIRFYLGDEDISERLAVKTVNLPELNPETHSTVVHLECYADEVVLEDVAGWLEHVETITNNSNRVPQYTEKQTREVLKELGAQKGFAEVRALLKECDARTFKDVHEDHYGWIVDQARNKLREKEAMTPEQVGMAQSLLARRKELESTIKMIEQFNIPDGGAEHLFAVKVHSGGHESRLNLLGADIVNYLTMELNDNLSRLEKLGVRV